MSAISCILIALMLIEIILLFPMIYLYRLFCREADEGIRLTGAATDECLKRHIPLGAII
ncbi:hypothetical protein [Gardnerella vaginalis]|uniref:hypothetical protein n=1 Tax=Gardnerella vaginalis TaxID=2702 RepID=UPI00159D4CBC|nr:hypothetical protein [Gardnerella vaginalis]